MPQEKGINQMRKKQNRFAQMEIMGLVIIVILITIGVVFTFTFMFRSDQDVQNEVVPKTEGRAFMTTLLNTHFEQCGGNSYGEIMQACFGSSALKCDQDTPLTPETVTGLTACTDLASPCCFLQHATSKLIKSFYGSRKKTVYMYAKVTDDKKIFDLTKEDANHKRCLGEIDQISQPYSITTGQSAVKLTLKLDLCRPVAST